MSSITAAPRMIRASVVAITPRSRSTRAVIPTVVATRPLATKASVGCCVGCRDMNHSPRANGNAIPSTATSRARGPTRRMSETRVSRPTKNSRTITPSSAITW